MAMSFLKNSILKTFNAFLVYKKKADSSLGSVFFILFSE